MTDPITVNSTPMPEQLGAALRQLLIAVGAYMAGRGWIDEGIAASLVPVLLILGPMLWSQLIVRSQNKDMQVMAEAAPDSVAQVK